MPSNETLKQNVKHVIIDLNQMKTFCEEPLIMNRAKGVEIWDVDGKRYLDGLSGVYVVNIGHGNEEVIEAIRKQQEKVFFVAPMHATSDIAIEYGAKLGELTPDGLTTMKMLTGGSEATENAMKMARQYHKQTGNPGKYKVVSLYKGFHGATLGAMSASGLSGPRKSVFGPFLEGFVHVPPPTCFRCPYGLKYGSCGIMCAKMAEYFIESEGPESVAAFILEPVGNTGGIVVPPPEYLPMIRKACDKHNVLLIFDEIITGAGRTGSWFAAQTFNTTPDLLCAGKGMSSGYAPLSCIAIKDDLYFSGFWGEPEQNVHFASGHTYGGNPISSAAGLAVANIVEREGLIEKGAKIGEYLRGRLRTEVAKLGVMGDVRGVGCLACIEFVKDMETLEQFPQERMFGKRVEKRIMEAGLLLRCDPHWISFAPPFITTQDQAEEMLQIFLKCVAAELKS